MAKKSFAERQSVVLVPLLLAVASAGIGVLADYLKEEYKFVAHSSVLNALIGAFIGGAIGVAYEVSKQLRETLERLEHVSTLATARVSLLTALPIAEILEESPSHLEVLCQLIGDSLKNVRFIANVDSIRYLTYLGKAVELSSEYEGIQRYPISWFKERQNAAVYLNRLRDRRMQRKLRLFLIDDKDEPAMQHDLQDGELLSFYWQHTGDVASYWITLSDLRALGLPAVDDCALYDRRLLIQYDETRSVLGFEFGKGGQIGNSSKVFGRLREQIELQALLPFKEIPHPRKPTTPATPARAESAAGRATV